MIAQWLHKLSLKRHPNYQEINPRQQIFALFDFSSMLLIFPLWLLTLIWLIRVTNWEITAVHWPKLLLIFLLYGFFMNWTFQIMTEVEHGIMSYSTGNLSTILLWSAALVLGETVYWIPFLVSFLILVEIVSKRHDPYWRWNRISNFIRYGVQVVLPGLIGLWLFQALGNQFPLTTFLPKQVGAAIAATAAFVISHIFIYAHNDWLFDTAKQFVEKTAVKTTINLLGSWKVEAIQHTVTAFFAILGGMIFVQQSFWVYIVFILGMLLVALLAKKLSQSTILAQQRARELGILENLGRAIINAPPDGSTLASVLQAHVSNMFPVRIRIWLNPDAVLYQSDGKRWPELEAIRKQIEGNKKEYYVTSGKVRWAEKGSTAQFAGLGVPILSETEELLGGIYVWQQEQGLDLGRIEGYVTAVQSLAAQIAAAQHRAEVHKQTIESEKMARELEVAGQIQNSFLPDTIPQPEGWVFSAELIPARQTSGDFYDFIPLEENKLGILVADVADKGTGAALYMALSRTLIRTYAMQHPNAPEIALAKANERILSDTQSDQFVTLFYGVVDLNSGTMTYCNAGHNPPLLMHKEEQATTQLTRTGIPLGMFEEMAWQAETVQIQPGEMLLMFTDGLPEAQNEKDELFEEARLLAVGKSCLGLEADQVSSKILDSINSFVGSAPQFDDITLMVVIRK